MEVINFNKKIYPRQAVRQAMEDFQDLARFSLSENSQYWRVKIEQINQQFKNIIKDEFANYVLGLLA